MIFAVGRMICYIVIFILLFFFFINAVILLKQNNSLWFFLILCAGNNAIKRGGTGAGAITGHSGKIFVDSIFCPLDADYRGSTFSFVLLILMISTDESY